MARLARDHVYQCTCIKYKSEAASKSCCCFERVRAACDETCTGDIETKPTEAGDAPSFAQSQHPLAYAPYPAYSSSSSMSARYVGSWTCHQLFGLSFALPP